MVLVLVFKLRREWIPEVRALSVQNRLDTKMLRVIKRIIEKKQKNSVKFQIRLAHSVEIELPPFELQYLCKVSYMYFISQRII